MGLGTPLFWYTNCCLWSLDNGGSQKETARLGGEAGLALSCSLGASGRLPNCCGFMSITSARLRHPGLPFHRKIEEDWETRDQKGDMLLPMHSLGASSEMPVSINPTIHLHPGSCIPTAATEPGAQFPSTCTTSFIDIIYSDWPSLKAWVTAPWDPLLGPQRWQHSWAAAPLLRRVAC